MKPPLNIRKMRTRFLESQKVDVPARKSRLKIRAIRTIETMQSDMPVFDHELLGTIVEKVAETHADFGVSNEMFDEAYDVWDIQALRFQDLNDIQSKDCKKAILSWCLNIIAQSETGSQLIEEAGSLGWKLGLEDLGGYDFHLDTTERIVNIDSRGMRSFAIARSGYFMNGIIFSIIRSMRDVWQEKRHGGFDEHYRPEDVLMLERVRAADLDLISVLVAWELRASGYSDLWRHVIGSPEGDIAMAFSASLESNVNFESSHQALVKGFRQWFASPERVNATDHETLDYLDGLVSTKVFGERKPTEIGVEILSCLPNKTAYLKGLGGEIMRDPAFSGLSDFINQSHFMQIMNDSKVVYAGGVAFHDADLAQKMFPGCEDETIH